MAMGVSITRSPFFSLSGPTLTRPVHRPFRYPIPLQGCPDGHQWLDAARRIKYLKVANTISDKIVSRQIQLPPQIAESGDENDEIGDVLGDEVQVIDEMPKPSVVEEGEVDVAEKDVKLGRGEGWAIAKEEEAEKKKILKVYESVVVVDSVEKAREIVGMLMTKYRDFVHACDMEASACRSMHLCFILFIVLVWFCS